jgi:hypothetical protein
MSNHILEMIDEIKRIEASMPVVNALTRPAPLARKLQSTKYFPGAKVQKALAAITKPKAATTRTAAEIMQLPAKEFQQLRNRASARGSKAAQEIKAAHASCQDPALRFELFQAFKTILTR